MGESSHRHMERTLTAQQRLKIVIIGAGNVAWHIAHALAPSVIQIYNHNIDGAKALAQAVNADFTDDIKQLSSADAYIISVKDDAISSIINEIAGSNGVWMHTSGSIPMNVFDGKISDHGVLYPMQTFTKGIDVDMGKVPFFIEANNNTSTKLINNIANFISHSVWHIDSEQRRRLHVAAVFACNFTNHMLAKSAELLKQIDLPLSVMQPLVDTTLDKAFLTSPQKGQTGPARRGDRSIIASHLSLIDNDDTRQLYEIISDSIIHQYLPTSNEPN